MTTPSSSVERSAKRCRKIENNVPAGVKVSCHRLRPAKDGDLVFPQFAKKEPFPYPNTTQSFLDESKNGYNIHQVDGPMDIRSAVSNDRFPHANEVFGLALGVA